VPRWIIQDRALRIATSTASVKGEDRRVMPSALGEGDDERQTAKKLV
jgi:hypothetical protein